jgi:hypothetical protein
VASLLLPARVRSHPGEIHRGSKPPGSHRLRRAPTRADAPGQLATARLFRQVVQLSDENESRLFSVLSYLRPRAGPGVYSSRSVIFFSLSSFSFVLIDPRGRGGVREHLRDDLISPADCCEETGRLDIARRFGSAMTSNIFEHRFHSLDILFEHMLVWKQKAGVSQPSRLYREGLSVDSFPKGRVLR